MRVLRLENRIHSAVRAYGVSSQSQYLPYIPVGMPQVDRFEKSPSFTSNPIQTLGAFRYLSKNHEIHCFYCKKNMFYGGLLDDLMDSGIFSGQVKDFVVKIKPYKKYLKNTQRAVFTQIERYAQKAPQTHLSEIIQDLYSMSIKRLVKVQKGIFKEMMDESKNLPSELKKPFRNFMRRYNKRLNEEPYQEEFSGKKYSYQVNKLKQSINNGNGTLRDYLERITTPLANPIFKDDSAIVPSEIRTQILGRKNTPEFTSKDMKLYVVSRVKRIGERLDRRDLVELSVTAQKMIEGKPVIIHFANKDFLYDLAEEVLLPVKKTDVYYKLMEIASKLPTSDTSINSFVVKHKFSNSDTIGYKLIEPSITTVEHLIPRSDGGEDILTNIVLACKACNNARMSTNLAQFAEKFPNENHQVYFNDIIKIEKSEHTITPEVIEGQAATVKNEGNIQIDLSELLREDT